MVRVPAPVLAEVCRGGAHNAPIDRILKGKWLRVVELTEAAARRAGSLLGRAKLDSTHAVDAFVVATALDFASAVIATGDPDDFSRLTIGLRQIRIFEI
jgi:hypothetical protein